MEATVVKEVDMSKSESFMERAVDVNEVPIVSRLLLPGPVSPLLRGHHHTDHVQHCVLSWVHVP